MHAERIDVGPRVDVEVVELGLLGAHVQRRADHQAVGRVQRVLGQRLVHRLGQAEVDHLGHRLAVVQADENVRRLQVAVDDPLLMGVLHGLADRHEQLRAARAIGRRAWSQYSVIGTPLTYSMTKNGRPSSVTPPSKTLAMFGWSIRASACRSASNRDEHLPAVHARLDELERHAAADRLGLLGDPDGAHAPFADLLQQLVAAGDDRARLERVGRFRRQHPRPPAAAARIRPACRARQAGPADVRGVTDRRGTLRRGKPTARSASAIARAASKISRSFIVTHSLVGIQRVAGFPGRRIMRILSVASAKILPGFSVLISSRARRRVP